ncbi:M23 family metallopeptidase [Bdellovibrionota bacterium FG-2]
MANRFYTLMLVPEKTSRVRKIVMPAWLLRGAAVGVGFLSLLGLVMILNYWYVMNQINENKQLKMENRRLRQQVQVFKNKMTTVEATMERVKTFATRLKVITNIEDRGSLLQSLNGKLPEAQSNIGQTPKEMPPSEATNTLAASQPPSDSRNPEDIQLRKEYERLDEQFSQTHREALYVEQMLQDEYELLTDQKSFLAAVPTRKPAIGYFTSGFGIRKSPYGGRVKMHEGLDIANRIGTSIRAPADGVVTFAELKAGYGNTVVIDHGYGVETWYGHNRKIVVTRGQKVRRGDVISLLGNSGRSTGPHVHYEVRVNGWPVDPLSYILEN